MSFYNTGNPVPSIDPRDLDDNAKKLDEAINSQEEVWVDRLGATRKSIKGVENGLAVMQEGFDEFIDESRDEFNSFLAGTQYEVPIAYTAGLNITRATQTVIVSGIVYRPIPGSLPFVTTTFGADSAKWAVLGDASLRQDLSALSGSDRSGYVRVAPTSEANTAAKMLSVQPVNIWESAFSSLVTSKPNPADPSTWDWRPAVQAAIDSGAPVHFPPGDYGLGGPVYLRDKTVLQGAGNTVTRLRPLGDYDCIRVWIDYVGGTGINRACLRDLMIYPFGNEGLTYTVGRAIHAKTSLSYSSKVWKLMLDNVQVYRIGGTALYLEGNSGASVAETLITNFEAKFCGENGIWENQYVYDTWLGQALLEDCKLFGARLQGGSATMLHMHAVACGTNDGAGTLAGGGFSIKGNYYDLINCHADRNYGHGYIIGGFGAEDLAQHNRLTDCLGFNSGNTAGTKTGRNMQVGAVRDLKVVSGFFGNIGASLLANNVYGVELVSPNTFQVDFIGTHFRGNQTQAVLFGASVVAGEVSFNSSSFEDNVSITNNYAKAFWIGANGAANKHIFNTQTWHGVSSALSFASTLTAGASIDPLGEIKASRSGAAAAQFQRNGGNGTIQEFWRANTKVGEVIVNTVGTQYVSASADFAQPPLKLGAYYLWVDGTGALRIKNGAPASATDGTVVGAQT
jgi:hypothetical protein